MLSFKNEYLECFKAVNEQKSFSRAADVLYISQSSVSKNISDLEHLVGGKLFVRDATSIQLTSRGKYLEKYFYQISNDLNELVVASKRYDLDNKNSYKIIVPYNFAYFDLLPEIVTLEKESSDLYFETTETNHQLIGKSLQDEEGDFIFGYKEILKSTGAYKSVDLLEDPLVFICNGDTAQKLHFKDGTELSRAKDEQFCFPKKDVKIFEKYLEVCFNAGFTPPLTYSDVHYSTIKEYVRCGVRCTITTMTVAKYLFNEDDFRIYHFKDAPSLTLSLYLNNKNGERINVWFSRGVASRAARKRVENQK